MSAPVSFASGRKVSSENGWVGATWSPGAAPCGTGRSGAGTISRAGAAVEHEEVAGLGRLQHAPERCRRAVGEVDQRRLRRQVHVPQIMVHGLVGPDALAGVDVERDQRAGIALRQRRAVAAPDIRRLHAHRQIDQAELRVVRRGRSRNSASCRCRCGRRTAARSRRRARNPRPRSACRCGRRSRG